MSESPTITRSWFEVDRNFEIGAERGCKFLTSITWGTFRDGVKADLLYLFRFAITAIYAIGHFLALVLFPIGMYFGYENCAMHLKYEMISMGYSLKNMFYYTVRAVPVIGYYTSVCFDRLDQRMEARRDIEEDDDDITLELTPTGDSNEEIRFDALDEQDSSFQPPSIDRTDQA